MKTEITADKYKETGGLVNLTKNSIFISFFIGTICFLVLLDQLVVNMGSQIQFIALILLISNFYFVLNQSFKELGINAKLVNTTKKMAESASEWQDKKNFIEAIIHDLKSPMFSEQRALEIMMAKVPMDTKILNEFLCDIYYTNQEVIRLIDNLSLTFKVHRGHYHQEATPCSIKSLIEEVHTTIKYLAENKNIHVEILNINDKPKVVIDYNELKRAFINIVENAIKFSPKSSSIVISSEIVDDFVLIKIEDHGYGIKKEDYYKIFDEFYTTSAKRGSGIGLYISKKIIEANGGSIWFESQENVGTTFLIKLKIANDSDKKD